MAAAILASLRTGDWIAGRLRGYSILLIAVSVLSFALLWTTGEGVRDRFDRPIGTDFSNPYAAGLMARERRGAAAYDFAALAAVEEQVTGQADNFYSWSYPPVFLLPAAALAGLPYLTALALWLSITFGLYLAAIRAILPDPRAWLAAAAFPAVFVTIGHGQNAFLTAGLLGLGLAWIDRRPFAAGLLIGCICYKPHLGLIIPLALIAGGRWRVVAGAGVSTLALCAASLAAFGPEPWRAFLASQDLTRTVILEDGAAGWFKMQSLFAALRGAGASLTTGYLAQGLLATLVAGLVARMWWLDRRGPVGDDAKAALAIGTLLATPYVLDYDMALLGPALAFMAAARLRRGFAPWDATLMALAWAAPLAARPAAQVLGLPLGLAAMLLLFVICVGRTALPAQDAGFAASGRAGTAFK